MSRTPLPSVLVLSSFAAIRVRGGALEIEHGAKGNGRQPSQRQPLRLDIDDPKPRAILFDAHGEFITGEALRWLARYGVALILPNGPGRILTFIESALEASQSALDRNPDIDPAVIRAQLAAPAIDCARAILAAKIEAEASHAGD